MDRWLVQTRQPAPRVTRTVTPNGQVSVPNSGTDIGGLTMSQLPCWPWFWDPGPSEAGTQSNQPQAVRVGRGGRRHWGQLPISGPQGRQPGRSLSVPVCFACSFVHFFDSAAQQGHSVRALPCGLLLGRLLFHRKMQTLDKVSDNEGAHRVC